ncbi:hypothetical protein [Ornithobacterium rhinotracheale]|nr:hypothetical protein [Ornithobacterium rhinotracheale]UVD87624.1 hypothetical protein NV236_01860 [Ornithobacterium rhinotracheale]
MKQVDNSYSMCDNHKKKLHLLADPYIKKLDVALSKHATKSSFKR